MDLMPRRRRLASLALAVGAVSYPSAMTYANWGPEMARASRLLVIPLVGFVVLVAVARLISTIARDFTTVLAALSFAYLVATSGVTFATSLDLSQTATISSVLLLAIVACVLTMTLRADEVLYLLCVVLGAVLILAPLAQYAWNYRNHSSSYLITQTPPATRVVSNGPLPDIWLVILDGYPAAKTVREVYGYRGSLLAEELADRGFVSNGNALTPYPVTAFSVPSILEVKHLADTSTASSGETLRSIVSGDNFFANSLRAWGYEVTIVQNAWRMSGCSTSTDNCVHPPLIDEPVSAVIQRSLVGLLADISWARSFEESVLASLNWLGDNAKSISENGTPDAVIVHLLSPHPPLVLRPDCSTHRDENGGGLIVWSPKMGDQVKIQRQDLFMDQVRCIDQTIKNLLAQLGDEAIVGVVGDHGPDSLGHSAWDPGDWGHEMLTERMLTIAAMRTKADCPMDLRTTLGVTAALLACVGGTEVATPEPRAFAVTEVRPSHYEVQEYPEHIIQSLLDDGRGSK